MHKKNEEKEAMQVFIHNNKSKKTYPTTRHTDSLYYSYFTRQGLTTHTHKPKEKKKGLPFCVVPMLAAGVSRALRRHVFSVRPAHTHRSRSLLAPSAFTLFLLQLPAQPCAVPTTRPFSLQPLAQPCAVPTTLPSLSTWPRLLLSSPAPSGRAFALLANRDSRHAPCPST